MFQALVGCHDIFILGKSPIKWRQRPDMALAVDWDVKHHFQTNKNNNVLVLSVSEELYHKQQIQGNNRANFNV